MLALLGEAGAAGEEPVLLLPGLALLGDTAGGAAGATGDPDAAGIGAPGAALFATAGTGTGMGLLGAGAALLAGTAGAGLFGAGPAGAGLFAAGTAGAGLFAAGTGAPGAALFATTGAALFTAGAKVRTDDGVTGPRPTMFPPEFVALTATAVVAG
jgi:hypothetical protein